MLFYLGYIEGSSIVTNNQTILIIQREKTWLKIFNSFSQCSTSKCPFFYFSCNEYTTVLQYYFVSKIKKKFSSNSCAVFDFIRLLSIYIRFSIFSIAPCKCVSKRKYSFSYKRKQLTLHYNGIVQLFQIA